MIANRNTFCFLLTFFATTSLAINIQSPLSNTRQLENLKKNPGLPQGISGTQYNLSHMSFFEDKTKGINELNLLAGEFLSSQEYLKAMEQYNKVDEINETEDEYTDESDNEDEDEAPKKETQISEKPPGKKRRRILSSEEKQNRKKEGRVERFFSAITNFFKGKKKETKDMPLNVSETDLHYNYHIWNSELDVGYAGWTNSDLKANSGFPAGADNFFVSTISKSNTVAFGVMGGKEAQNGNSNESWHFSRDMCHAAIEVFESLFSNQYCCAVQLLKTVYTQIYRRIKNVTGNADALFAVISKNYQIKLANTGANWLGLYRKGELVRQVRQNDQGSKHSLQLINQANANFYSNKWNEVNSLMNVYQWQLKKNDIIISVTNGVLQNIGEKTISKIIGDSFADKESMSATARKLVQTASGNVAQVDGNNITSCDMIVLAVKLPS